MAGLPSQFIGSSFWFLVGRSFSHLSSFLMFAVLARLLGPEDFGLVAFATVFVDLSRTVAFAGIPTALIRNAEWDDKVASTAFWGNLTLALAFVAILAGPGSIVLGYYYSTEMGGVLSALSVALFVDAARATHEAKLQREFQYKSLAKRAAIATALSGILGIVLALLGWGVWALVANRLANSLLQTMIVWRACRWTPQLIFDFGVFSSLFKFGIYLSAAVVCGQIDRRIPELVAGVFLGPVAVGYYRIGARMIGIVQDLTIMPFQDTAIATFSRVDGPDPLKQSFYQVTKIVTTIAIPVFFGFAIISNDIVPLLFGSKWEPSGDLMSIMAIASGAAIITNFAQPILVVVGKTHLATVRALLLLTSSLVCAASAAPFGVHVLALADCTRLYFTIIPTFFLLQSFLTINARQLVSIVLPPLISALFMVIFVVLLRGYIFSHTPEIIRLIATSIIGAHIYIITLRLFFKQFMLEFLQELRPLFKTRTVDRG